MDFLTVDDQEGGYRFSMSLCEREPFVFAGDMFSSEHYYDYILGVGQHK
jgi:hypothetical protein